MAVDLFVTIRITMEPCDPTGEACKACGDIPWLRAAQVFVSVNGDEPSVAAYVCEGCAEECRERLT